MPLTTQGNGGGRPDMRQSALDYIGSLRQGGGGSAPGQVATSTGQPAPTSSVGDLLAQAVQQTLSDTTGAAIAAWKQAFMMLQQQMPQEAPPPMRMGGPSGAGMAQAGAPMIGRGPR